MFCRPRSKSRCFWFSLICMSFGVPPSNIFEKKRWCRNRFKKGCPLIQTSGYDHDPRLPDRLPRVRISQTRNNSSSSKCCSSSCPWLWFPKIARQWLFELLASIANVSETNRKNERVDVKSTSLVIWYALGKVHITLAFVCSCNGCSCILFFSCFLSGGAELRGDYSVRVSGLVSGGLQN